MYVDNSGNVIDDDGNIVGTSGQGSTPYNGPAAPAPGTPGVNTGPTPLPTDLTPGAGYNTPYGPGNPDYPTTTPPPGTTAPPPDPTTPPPKSTIGPFNGTFSAPSWLSLPSVPTIGAAPTPDLPTYQTPAAYTSTPFQAPSVSDILASPDFTQTVAQGDQGLQAWAASRGTLNDSGTGKALEDYNRNAANTQIQSIWNRDLGAWQANQSNNLATYNTNVQSQNVQPYQFATDRAMAQYQPQLATWQANADMVGTGYTAQAQDIEAKNNAAQTSAWNQYLSSLDLWKFNTTNALNP